MIGASVALLEYEYNWQFKLEKNPTGGSKSKHLCLSLREPATVAPVCEDKLFICVLLQLWPQGFCFLTGNEWLLESPVITGNIVDLSKPLSISAKLPAAMKDSISNPSLTLGVWVYYCMETGKACTMKAASFTQPLEISANPREGEVTVALAHTF